MMKSPPPASFLFPPLLLRPVWFFFRHHSFNQTGKLGVKSPDSRGIEGRANRFLANPRHGGIEGRGAFHVMFCHQKKSQMSNTLSVSKLAISPSSVGNARQEAKRARTQLSVEAHTVHQIEPRARERESPGKGRVHGLPSNEETKGRANFHRW